MAYHTTLLAVTGLSPQVITETLYAINKAQLDWPDSIKIITTRRGREEARLGLLVAGNLAALCEELQRPQPAFTEQDILVVPDANGQEVDDARTLADQSAVADFITAQVATLTQDQQLRLHASIAGGRKTMTFYLGYAMTIFGRDTDRLSHVLVSEPYEAIPDFYYPTKHSKRILTRSGMQLDARDAQITLAEIPFISQRSLFKNDVMQEFTRMSYNELIRQMQLVQQPDKIRLAFYFHRHTPKVQLNNLTLDFSKRKLEFVFWAMIARPRADDDDVSIERPTDDLNKALITKHFLYELTQLAQLFAPARSLAQLLEQLYDHDVLEQKTVDALLKSDGVNDSFFDTRRNNLREHLHSLLPSALVELLMPAIITKPDGSALTFGQSSQRGSYGMWLSKHQITMHNT